MPSVNFISTAQTECQPAIKCQEQIHLYGPSEAPPLGQDNCNLERCGRGGLEQNARCSLCLSCNSPSIIAFFHPTENHNAAPATTRHAVSRLSFETTELRYIKAKCAGQVTSKYWRSQASHFWIGSVIRSRSKKSLRRKSCTSPRVSGPPMLSISIPVFGFLREIKRNSRCGSLFVFLYGTILVWLANPHRLCSMQRWKPTDLFLATPWPPARELTRPPGPCGPSSDPDFRHAAPSLAGVFTGLKMSLC